MISETIERIVEIKNKTTDKDFAVYGNPLKLLLTGINLMGVGTLGILGIVYHAETILSVAEFWALSTFGFLFGIYVFSRLFFSRPGIIVSYKGLYDKRILGVGLIKWEQIRIIEFLYIEGTTKIPAIGIVPLKDEKICCSFLHPLKKLAVLWHENTQGYPIVISLSFFSLEDAKKLIDEIRNYILLGSKDISNVKTLSKRPFRVSVIVFALMFALFGIIPAIFMRFNILKHIHVQLFGSYCIIPLIYMIIMFALSVVVSLAIYRGQKYREIIKHRTSRTTS